ncbi:MAG: PilZ domain-containing protein [Myxococcota bacterium]
MCEPRFDPAEEITVDVLVGFERETGIRLKGRVTHVARGALTDDERWGIRVVWQEARSKESSHGLTRFLERILGIPEAHVGSDGAPPYVFTHRFAAPSRPTRPLPAQPAAARMATTADGGARDLLHARLGRPGHAPGPATTPPAGEPSREAVSVDEERRGRPRIELSTPVTWLTASAPHVGRARSLSRSGIYVETEDALPDIGERVVVRFPIPHAGKHQLVILTTQVVRHRHAGEQPGAAQGFAAKYVMVDELGRPGLLQHFLQSHGVDD